MLAVFIPLRDEAGLLNESEARNGSDLGHSLACRAEEMLLDVRVHEARSPLLYDLVLDELSMSVKAPGLGYW